MSKSVFLARTPLQVINCNEAKKEFNINDSHSVLILFTDYKPSLTQILNNIHYQNWKKVHCLFQIFDKKNKLLFIFQKFVGLIKLLSLSRRYNNCEYLFVGHIDDAWMRFIIKRVKYKKLVLLEDGVATIDIAGRRLNSSLNSEFPMPPGKKSRKIFGNDSFEYYLLGKQRLILRQITFFTAYNNILISPQDELIENRFSHLKSNKKPDQVKKREVWFIGQPLLERGIISKDDFKGILQRIKKVWRNGYSYFYVAHRSSRIPNAIYEEGFSLLRFDDPIEKVLVTNNSIPGVIGSVNSAALLNISKIFYPEEVKLFFIEFRPEYYRQNPASKKILDYYRNFTKMEPLRVG